MVTINDQQFIAIDWGTTHYRMYLVNSSEIQVLHSFSSHEGIKYMHQQCEFSRQERDSFFIDFLAEKLSTISDLIQGNEAILVSGMASSTIGMRSLPYAQLPFDCSGSNIVVEEIIAKVFKHRIYLISGIRADEDVMRGEETQLLGLTDVIDANEYIIILPGTHSKHVFIRQGQMVDFKT